MKGALLKKSAVISVVLMLLIGFPVQKAVHTLTDQEQSREQQKLATYLKSQATKTPIYIISAFLTDQYPLLDNVGKVSPSRYAHMWPILAFMRAKNATGMNDPAVMDKILLQSISDDFAQIDPHLVVIEQREYNMGDRQQSFPYLAVLKKNKQFSDLWNNGKNYRLIDHIGIYAIYQKNRP